MTFTGRRTAACILADPLTLQSNTGNSLPLASCKLKRIKHPSWQKNIFVTSRSGFWRSTAPDREKQTYGKVGNCSLAIKFLNRSFSFNGCRRLIRSKTKAFFRISASARHSVAAFHALKCTCHPVAPPRPATDRRELDRMCQENCGELQVVRKGGAPLMYVECLKIIIAYNHNL